MGCWQSAASITSVAQLTLQNIKNQQLHDQSFIQMLINQLQNDETYSLLLNSQFLIDVLAQYKKCYFSHSSTVQIFEMILDFMALSKNYEAQTSQLQTKLSLDNFASRMGEKWLKIKTEAYFQNKYALKVFGYFCKTSKKTSNEYSHCYLDLKFDLSLQEGRKVVSAVKEQCRYQLRSFCFLTNYLYKSCINLQKQGLKLPQIQAKLLQLLNVLAKENPPAPPLQGVQELFQCHKSTCDTSIKFECLDLRPIPSQSRMLELQNFIGQKIEKAKPILSKFNELIRDQCLSEGYHYRSGLKIANISQTRALQRVKQKLLDNEFTKYSITKQTEKHQKTSLQLFSQHEMEYYQAEMKKLYANLDKQMEFKLTDLVRGKCMFATIKKINDCCSTLRQLILKSNCKLVQVDNRLRGKTGTSDIVLKIKIQDIIAQLQLVIDLNINSYEFAHKLYEIMRSKFFSALTTLKIMNEEITLPYLKYIQKITRINVGSSSKHNYKENCNYSDVDENIESLVEILPIMRQDRQKLRQNSQNWIMQQFFTRYAEIIHQKSAKIQRNEGDSLFKLKKNMQFKYAIIDFDSAVAQIEKYMTQFKQKHSDLLQKVEKRQNYDQNECRLLKQYGQMIKMRGKIYQSKGMNDKGIEYCLSAIDFFQKISLKESNILISKLRFNIGWLYYKKGNYTESLKIYEACRQSQEKTIGKDHLEYASTLNNIGLVYSGQGNYKVSLQYYMEALSIREKLNGKENYLSVSTLNNIGLVYNYQGNYQEALKYFERCLDLKEKKIGKMSTQYALTLNNIGLVYANHGNYQKALQTYQRSVDIREKIKGKNSYDNTSTFNNIADINVSLGNYDKALEFYQKSLEIRIQTNGKETVEVAKCRQMIGELIMKKGDYKESQASLNEALKILESKIGIQNVTGSNMFLTKGILYCQWSKFTESLEFLQKSQQIATKLNGEDAINNYKAELWKGKVYIGLKDIKQALKHLQKSLQSLKRIKGEDNISATNILNQFGRCYTELQDYQNAKEYFQKSLRICQKNHYLYEDYGKALLGLGKINYYLNSFKQASSYLQSSTKILQRYRYDREQIKDLIQKCKQHISQDSKIQKKHT